MVFCLMSLTYVGIWTTRITMIFFRPKVNHPVFYGCFDWHSSVHGHWLLAALARRYPGTELADNVTAVFNEQFKVPFTIALSHIYLHIQLEYNQETNWFYGYHNILQEEKIVKELKIFKSDDHFERTYGMLIN